MGLGLGLHLEVSMALGQVLLHQRPDFVLRIPQPTVNRLRVRVSGRVRVWASGRGRCISTSRPAVN